MRHRLQLALQVLLVLIASLLGIATNYATNVDEAPWLLRVIQQVSVPAIGLLVVAMVVGQVVVYRLENPAPPPVDWPHDRVPYPGLDAFEEDESAVFFGRETQVADVCRRVHASSTRSADRFLVVVGPSGSGKSSLVRAGVVPRLRKRRWTILPAFSPGPNPLGALAAAFVAADGDQEQVGTVLRRIRQGPRAVRAELARLRGGRFGRTMVVIDQFEELLTLAGERERAQFVEAVSDCLEHDPGLRVIATLRVEFLGPLLHSEHAHLVQRPIVIGALGRERIAEVVRRPAELVGLTFAPGLVERIVADVETEDALPLLAYLLQELYFASRPGSAVTQALYEELGGVPGALARQADHTVAQLGADGGMPTVLDVLLKFVTVHGHEVARRRVPLSELSARERRIVDAFVDARLLMSDVSGHADAGQPYGQVTHEALFRQWAPLRQEVEARADHLRRRAELERWAEDWEQAGRSDDYLLTGERLALAQRWLADLENTGQAADAARALVRASERRDHDFLYRVSDNIGQYALGSAETQPERAILLSLAAFDECVPTPSAGRSLMKALALSHLSARLDGHTDAVRDVAWSPDGRLLATASRDGTARIFDAASGRSVLVLPADGAMTESVSWSPDSAFLATSGREHVVRIWDVASGQPVRLLTGATDVVRQVAWAPDGRHVAATSRDRLVRVWSATTGQLVHTLHGHHDDVWGVAWAPDGTRVASASHDQSAIVWDVATGQAVTTMRGHSDFVEGIAWSPDGMSLATGSGDQTVRIWDAHSGEQRLLVRGHADYVWNIAWSPDGRMLASASSDRTVRIVSTADAEVLAVLRGHTDTVWGVAWSPSGRRLATSSTDTFGAVWELRPRGAEEILADTRGGQVNRAAWNRTGERLVTACDDGSVHFFDAGTGALSGPSLRLDDRVWCAAWSPRDDRLALSANDGLFRIMDEAGNTLVEDWGEVVESCGWSPDGGRVATGGHDGAVRVRAAQTGTELVAMTGHQDWVGCVRWSPSGRYLASASDDRTCRLWDVAEGRQLTVLRGHDNYVDDAAWSPDEQRVVTASGDWTAGVWDATTGRLIELLKGHEGRVRAVAWSPDGALIATGSDDGTVRVWSASTLDEKVIAGVHTDKVTSVAWSEDGARLLSASSDGTARIWSAAPDFDRIQAHARGRVFRMLTQDERSRHLLPATSS